jgi:hypothetical protein
MPRTIKLSSQNPIRLLLALCLVTQSHQDRFMIPHTHLDLGWLMTAEEYYQRGVSAIYESVLSALENSPGDVSDRLRRRFGFSEVGFLKMYLKEKPELADQRLHRIRSLLAKGQLEFINGAMSEADEACPGYEDFMDNFFYGQRFLMTRFGKAAKSSWQIKSFGHSKAFFFLARKFGLTHAIITKMTDYKKEEWFRFRNLETMYKFPDNSTMFLHVLYDYTGPSSIACDNRCDISQFDKSKLDEEFVHTDYRYVWDQYYLIGGDFHFENAAARFEYLDKVIAQYPEMQYALPSDYWKSFEQKHTNLDSFSSDLFVYQEGSMDSRIAWSGFFTSKPRLKYKIRQVGKNLRAVKALLIVFLTNGSNDPKVKSALLDEMIDMLEDFGVLLHHQTITGTSVEIVDEDCFRKVADLEKRLTGLASRTSGSNFGFCDFNDYETSNSDSCALADLLLKNHSADFVIYNPSAVETMKMVKLVVKRESDTDVISIRRDDQEIVSIVNCPKKSHMCQIMFIATLSPFRLAKYTISLSKATNSNQPPIITDDGSKAGKTSQGNLDDADPIHQPKIIEIPSDGLNLTFDYFKLTISRFSITYQSTLNSNFTNTFWFSQIKPQASGHYITEYWAHYGFKYYNEATGAYILESEDIQGVGIVGTKIDLKIFQIKGENFYHIESFVKNTRDFFAGLDVLLNVKSPKINSGDAFITDSNGLFDMQRKFDLRWEDSIFPVTSFIRINDTNSNLGLAIFNDRTQGGIATNSTMSLYLQRAASTSDHKGNYEILSVNNSILTHHIIYNFVLDSTTEDADFSRIKHLSDTEFPLFAVQPNNSPTQSVTDDNLADWSKYSRNLRVGFDFYDSSQQMMRVKNTSRNSTLSLNVAQLVRNIVGDVSASEIDFDYFFSEDKSQKVRPLRPVYDIGPLDFVCVLISNFN